MASHSTLLTNVSQAFSRLTERERRLLVITAAVAVVLLLVLASTLMSGALEKREKRVTMRRDEIAQIESLRDKYQEAVMTDERNKRRITGNSASLFSLLQKSAGEVGLALTDLNERRAPVKDAADITEVTVDLNLKEITVDKMNTLLEKIEGKRTDGVIKVSKLKVKTRFDNPEMLEAGMTVATWKSTAAPGAPATETP